MVRELASNTGITRRSTINANSTRICCRHDFHRAETNLINLENTLGSFTAVGILDNKTGTTSLRIWMPTTFDAFIFSPAVKQKSAMDSRANNLLPRSRGVVPPLDETRIF
jgi:hypothetical protein